ncbi:hypothetical protein [Streptomonospora salina]|uniref:hypothetical protein n=1 Tax=Streptomonospora salina TaxID=104205 RepID=UPI0031ED05DD
MNRRGLPDRFLACGRRDPLGGGFAGARKPPPERLGTAHPSMVAIPQPTTGRLLIRADSKSVIVLVV